MLSRDHAGIGSLQIQVRFTPSILVDDIGERDTADWPEPTHRVADRQQGIGVDTRTASLVRPPPLSRTANTASLESHRGRALGPRAACSAPQGRWMTQTCGSVCRLRGKGRSTPGPHGYVRPDIPLRPAAVKTAPGSCLGPVRQTNSVVRPARRRRACSRPRLSP